MTYREKINHLAVIMDDRKYQPVFKGDADAAVEYMDQFTNRIMTYYQSVLVCGLFESMKAMGAAEDMEEQEEELKRNQDAAREAAAKAIEDLNRVCEAYGEGPLVDIDTKDPDAIHAFVGEFCSELSREED